MEQKIDITKYPEGLKYLAQVLELPIPKENTQAREDYIFNFVKGLISL